jgi:glycosyltransferase involved in cell wall biosynthesis
MPEITVSVVVNNYNYGRFLQAAVDSALAQTYPKTEVIVVDDGSTDESRRILEGYADRCAILLKDNGGQASAFNCGFRASTGEIVMFLDSDDTLYPDAASEVVDAFNASPDGLAKLHFRLDVIDETGRRTGSVVPSPGVFRPEGNMAQVILEQGPAVYVDPHPTTANAFSRRALTSVMPIPEANYRICADAYLLATVPLYGRLESLDHVLGTRRFHSSNYFRSGRLDLDHLRLEFHFAEARNSDLRNLIVKADACLESDHWTTPRQRALRLAICRLDSTSGIGAVWVAYLESMRATATFGRWKLLKRLKYLGLSTALLLAPRATGLVLCQRVFGGGAGRPELGEDGLSRA